MDPKREIYEFHNIPYALPPIGNKRFSAAEICSKNENCREGPGIFDASKDVEIKCIQYRAYPGENHTENCLKLTIRSDNLSASKPVIVWIHGGGLLDGHGNKDGYGFDAQVTDVLDAVTVNLNYRLGLLGFNVFEETWNDTSGVYANNGIRDQTVALQWIQENIASFGGDPQRVTIIGHSGGATAVLCLLSSPLANNLFHNAWSISPAPEIRYGYKTGKGFQEFVPRVLGCTQGTLVERRQCLLDLDPMKFTAMYLSEGNSMGLGYFDFPKRYSDLATEYVGLVYTDPTVITQSFRELKDAPFRPSSKLKVIFSNTAQEPAGRTDAGVPGVKTRVFPKEALLRETLTKLFKNITNAKDIVDKTFDTLYPNKIPQLVWDTLVSDLRQTCPNNDVAEAMSQSPNHEVYRLYVSNTMELLPISSFHGWDTSALFGFKLNYVPGERDIKFQKELRRILKNLAYGKIENGWGKFPSKTMELGNGADIPEIKIKKPQEEICNYFTALDINKYGAQN
uniref:Carboxylic ester hydrolase n=1 Tax=Lampea lactea TaxID=1403706 RepID=V9PPC0_9METZ|nr:carboxylesterase [Lampea lactea]